MFAYLKLTKFHNLDRNVPAIKILKNRYICEKFRKKQKQER